MQPKTNHAYAHWRGQGGALYQKVKNIIFSCFVSSAWRPGACLLYITSTLPCPLDMTHLYYAFPLHHLSSCYPLSLSRCPPPSPPFPSFSPTVIFHRHVLLHLTRVAKDGALEFYTAGAGPRLSKAIERAERSERAKIAAEYRALGNGGANYQGADSGMGSSSSISSEDEESDEHTDQLSDDNDQVRMCCTVARFCPARTHIALFDTMPDILYGRHMLVFLRCSSVDRDVTSHLKICFVCFWRAERSITSTTTANRAKIVPVLTESQDRPGSAAPDTNRRLDPVCSIRKVNLWEIGRQDRHIV